METEQKIGPPGFLMGQLGEQWSHSLRKRSAEGQTAGLGEKDAKFGFCCVEFQVTHGWVLY